jgi:protein ImuB
MPRIMTIWLPRWPVQRRLIKKPELRRVPVFVCRRERRGVMTVVSWAWAALPKAKAKEKAKVGTPRGRSSSDVRPVSAVKIPEGMSLAEAMAVLALAHGSRACHVAEIDHDDPVADRLALEEIARWCRRFAPIAAVEDAQRPECIHVDVTGTADFFGGEGSLVRTAVWTLAARGIHARAAIADTPAAAWAAAHHTDALHPKTGRQAGRHWRWAVIPRGEQVRALAALPASSLRLGESVLPQLRDVGIDSIGGIARLPRKSLASRFDPQLSRRLAEFTGERAEPLAPPCSGELPSATHAFEVPILLCDTAVDDLAIPIGRLVERCIAPLVAQGRGVLALQVRLERSRSGNIREACAPTVVDIGLFRPSVAASHLVDLVRLRLVRMRMPGEIEGITVEVVSAGEACCRQRMLFNETAKAFDGTAEASAAQVGMLLDRLSGRLGRGAVFEPKPVADSQPEHAWTQKPPSTRTSPPSGRHGRGAAERRPIWMLPQPLRLETVSVAPDGPPVRFRLGSQTNEIVKAHGPERIETAWWRGPTVRRDYYVAETQTGERYWLFRELRSGGWFLHGMFA